MANLRSIKIVQAGNLATFQPDPAGVQPGDRIHWNNESNNDHQVQVSDDFMTDNIAGGAVSNPGYIATKGVSYQCVIHPQEQGTIQIVPAVVMAPPVLLAAAVSAVASLASGAAAPPAAPAVVSLASGAAALPAAPAPKKVTNKKGARKKKGK